MVTLQILVLSFLVRIQVAQLNDSQFEGRFFVLYARVSMGGTHSVLVAVGYFAPMQALCRSPYSRSMQYSCKQ